MCRVERTPKFISFGSKLTVSSEETFFYVGDKYNVVKVAGYNFNNKFGGRKWVDENGNFVGHEADRVINAEYYLIESSSLNVDQPPKSDLERRRDSVRALKAVSDF